MTRDEQQWVEILSRLVIVKHEVAFVDFEEMKYMGMSIGDIMDDQGWIGYLKGDGIASVDMGWIRYLKRDNIAFVDLVQEFYVALLDVEDIEAMLWTVIVHGVAFQLSPNILAAFMGLQGLIGTYPTVEMGNMSDDEDIFHTFISQDVVLVEPFIRQKFMLLFWHILHLIFAYDIESRAHTAKCSILRGELILSVARGCVVDLPFFSIVWVAWIVRMRKGRRLSVPSVEPLRAVMRFSAGSKWRSPLSVHIRSNLPRPMLG
ncbi:hypothetical protein CJ030_MR5G019249 [Morella rubra]|uniref:Uncharacterized protein n=1 Tax=Morella rubra TaxID=262757 RepID=A0A6A1VMS4_9ROSI|nr:hypothetical protein CJ030_MR5G019249 [Morella rubra]